MTFIPQNTKKHCLITCSSDAKLKGLCHCHNNIKNIPETTPCTHPPDSWQEDMFGRTCTICGYSTLKDDYGFYGGLSKNFFVVDYDKFTKLNPEE